MHYKTIVLELLEQQTKLYEQLQKTHQLLPTLEALATQLRDHHMAITESLTQANPASDPSQIPAHALEIAIRELEDHLLTASQTDNREEFPLEQAMAFIRNPSSPE